MCVCVRVRVCKSEKLYSKLGRSLCQHFRKNFFCIESLYVKVLERELLRQWLCAEKHCFTQLDFCLSFCAGALSSRNQFTVFQAATSSFVVLCFVRQKFVCVSIKLKSSLVL